MRRPVSGKTLAPSTPGKEQKSTNAQYNTSSVKGNGAKKSDFRRPKDPDASNVNKDLKFPADDYESITEYHEEKAEAAG
jgi:hypothetical protein